MDKAAVYADAGLITGSFQSGVVVERQSISLIGFSVFFGILLGLTGLLGVLFSNGYFNDDEVLPPPALTGMELLSNYQCAAAETKQILIKGTEDNYDLAGIEATEPGEVIREYWLGFKEGNSRSKPYDDLAQNKQLADTFTLSPRVFRGLFVVRLKELSKVKNDNIGLGYATREFPQIDYSYGYSANISSLKKDPIWENDNDLYSVPLEDLYTKNGNNQERLIDVIRDRARDLGPFNLLVSDDTVVDFAGFAVCLEPEVNKGTVYHEIPKLSFAHSKPLSTNLVALGAASIDGILCGYGGCLRCEEKRPVSCILDKSQPTPPGLTGDARLFWSGGKIKFTTPVAGADFATEDDVNEFCASTFGDGWRVVSRHDGHSIGKMIGEGQFPADTHNAWVTMKDQPHDNCWRLRPDYRELPEAGNDR